MDAPITIAVSFDNMDQATEFVEALKLYRNKQHQPVVVKAVKVTAVKVCENCGKDFHPNSNRQMRCSKTCGMKPAPKKKKLEPISKTIREVERAQAEREHKPVSFDGSGHSIM